ncbi:hypothetical protein F0562_017416 [Nyssa sinensis]|uniref:Uncharacterized protein n=1 Tax=Nyssa sinensis TaxID=561372 RepID=A0A5J4ZES0_9ASTE|nr:hypothetical protein F0562_017416 [Nyssa sinensis]
MLLDDGLPNDLESLPSLEVLNLSRNKFHCLPASISRLSKLRILELSQCTMLKSIPDLPANLRTIEIVGADQLREQKQLKASF